MTRKKGKPMPFDGAQPAQPPQPDFQAIAQAWAQLRLDECNRMGSEIVALRLELATVKAALEAARKRIEGLAAEKPAAPED
jgi:hypothetical protein